MIGHNKLTLRVCRIFHKHSKYSYEFSNIIRRAERIGIENPLSNAERIDIELI